MKSRLIRIVVYFIAWTLIVFAFGCLSYFTVGGLSFWDVLMLSAIRFYVWAALFPFVFRITRRLRFENLRQWLYGAFFHLSVGCLLSLLHSTIYIALYWAFQNPGEVALVSDGLVSIDRFYVVRFFNSLYFDILIYGLIIIAIHAFRFYQSYQEGERKASILEAQLADSRLRALQMQLHPHFLFNALHSIGSLIFEDPQKANRMVTRLGDFLRLTLEHSEDQLVLLGQELEFLRCYLEIEQVRFQDRLSVCIETDPLSLSASVPYLILQPIVENAIRHGISPYAGPGRIKIETRRLNDSLWLQVEDNGPGIPPEDQPKPGKPGRGLLNVRARLEQLYGDAYRLELVNLPEGGLAVTVKVPFEPEAPPCVTAMGESS